MRGKTHTVLLEALVSCSCCCSRTRTGNNVILQYSMQNVIDKNIHILLH